MFRGRAIAVIVPTLNRGLLDGRYKDSEGYVWSVARLIEHAKELKPFDLPLVAIDISRCVFGSSDLTVRALAEHVKRTREADFQYPVIMDPDGFIVDGWHRVIKALVAGREKIKAVRFETMPVHEYREE